MCLLVSVSEVQYSDHKETLICCVFKLKVNLLVQVSDGYQVTLESSRQIQRKISQPSSLSQDEVLQVLNFVFFFF